jgi:hypothetical protein
MRLRRPRRELIVVGSLALAIAVGIGSMGGAYLLYRLNHDWTDVATVNGHSISREALRGRMAALTFLAGERIRVIDRAFAAGDITADQSTTLQKSAAADTSLEAARESLLDDELLAELAARDGVAAPATADPWTQAMAYAVGDASHRVRYVRFGLPTAAGPRSDATTPSSAAPSPNPWPTATQANVDAATARVRAELTADTPVVTIVASLHDAGWQVLGEDVAVSSEGVPADNSLDLDPAIAAAALTGSSGGIVGPTTDPYGRVSIAKLLPTADATSAFRRLAYDASEAKLDDTALKAWADGRVLRRAVTAHLLAAWSKGVNEARFRELVVGPAPDSSASGGPWVELSGLAVDRLKGIDPTSVAGAPANLDLNADSLAKTLKAMTANDRSKLFRSLVVAANGKSAQSGSGTSGELGFYTKEGLISDVSKSAFAESTQSGDVLGPIATSGGSQLFLVEARYDGALDDRSKIALGQIRTDPAPDFASYTKQYSPADVALAADAGWRAEPEFGATEAVRAALFATPIGAVSDPFVLDGKLAVAMVTERKSAVPDARTLARLTLDGYDAWFGSEYAKAKITLSDHPLPELEPSASPSPTAAPAVPSAPVLDTPNVPAIPGVPTAAPVKTDAMGLPVLP